MFPGFSFVRLLYLWLLLSGFSASAASETSPAWRNAMTAYQAGDFEKAVEGFKRIATDGKEISAALCHNIANCEYKLSNEASASLWYRRAIALDRWLPESQQNLRFLHKKNGFLEFEPAGIVWFASLLHRSQWMTACQGAAWIAGIAIVWLVWATPRPGRRWPLVTLLALAMAVLGTAIAGLIGKHMDNAPLAKRLIGRAENAAVHTAPAEAAGTVISLPPGSELLPIRTEGLWTYCDLPGGDKGAPLRGWVRTTFTEPFWPWSPSLIE